MNISFNFMIFVVGLASFYSVFCLDTTTNEMFFVTTSESKVTRESNREKLLIKIRCSVRNKQLPTCPPRVEIAGGKLIDL